MEITVLNWDLVSQCKFQLGCSWKGNSSKGHDSESQTDEALYFWNCGDIWHSSGKNAMFVSETILSTDPEKPDLEAATLVIRGICLEFPGVTYM